SAESADAFAKSVLVCGGDVSAGVSLRGCLIVARGTVRCPKDVQDCVILAGGDVTFPKRPLVQNCLIRSRGRVALVLGDRRLADVQDSESKEKDKDALSCVRFFETKHVGVEAEPAKDGVRVSRLDADGPFARAGCQT